MIQMNLSMKHKQTHRYREQVVVGKGVGVEEGLYWEFGISRCKLLYREWINKVLHRKLYSISCNKSYGKEQCVYIYIYINQCSVQSLSRVGLLAIPWTAACQASLSITNSWSLLKRMSIESVMPSSYLILCHPLLLPPSIFPSIRVFSNESVLHIRWPKYWSISFSISSFNEYSGLISFRMDWLDFLAVQETLKSLI